ncbi:MAG: LuxR family transcriptional regulator [Chloroflexota bacterium]
MLRNCPGLRILATSREPLHITGETVWRVPSLTLPARNAAPSCEQVLESEAARLFIERASAVDTFTLSENNARSVARLCELLDGVPLAIELAAARMSVLSVDQIVGRLDDRLAVLAGGSRTAPRRQQALQATIDWSYDLLGPDEQLLFARLSVFAGGWTLEAAEGVCAGEGLAARGVLELLALLVDKSLVLADSGPADQKRYRLLDSVRQYAEQRLSEAGATALVSQQHRHCLYFCALALEVESRVLHGAANVDWLMRLDTEQANLRAALRWSLSRNDQRQNALTLAAHLGHYWYTRGDRDEGRTWLDAALARQSRSGDEMGVASATSERAWALLWSGGLAHGQSDYVRAIPLLRQALALFEELNDHRGVGWGLSFLGHVARARSELEQAADFLQRAVEAFRLIGDDLGIITPLAALGFTMCLLGDQHSATRLLDDSVALARRTGSRGRLAIALIYLGQVAFAQSNPGRARAALQEGLRLSHEWNSAWGMAECLEGLAVVAGAHEQPERAARLLGAAARLRQSIGAPAHPVDRVDHERTVTAIQVAMDSEAFTSAWAAGAAAALDDMIEYAISPATGGFALDTPGVTKPAALLTVREREVAALVARGLSNREIAAALVIAERTVTNHIEHVFNKLSFRSRAQVAVWATEQRLGQASRQPE